MSTCPDCFSSSITEYMLEHSGEYAFSHCDICESEFDDGREDGE